MISIDGDTSTNDTVFLLANGQAGNQPLAEGDPDAPAFEAALREVATTLAKEIARDGEGATKLIEVTVSGAASMDDARLAARTVVSSNLLKSAVYGNDPNWGRILAAIGRSGAEVNQDLVDIFVGELCLMRRGVPQEFDNAYASSLLKASVVTINANLGLGNSTATAWGCDLTEEYVVVNSAYTT
jgi:glutamate N-acetyltransferase/amino-acid N-acetyltransferase